MVTDTYTYDVFGAVSSSTGSSDNVFRFTGEQSDGALAIEAIETQATTSVVSSSNLTGATVANLEDDPDDADANWATATALGDTEVRIGFPTPSEEPVSGADLQEFRVLLRKDASGGTDPTYSIELWETGGGSALATLASGVTLSSDTGTVVSVTWNASSLGTADGSAVEVRIVGTASVDRSVEVGAVEWNALVPATGADLYFLRARYYDPATGRFISQDPTELLQRYAYASGNPALLVDPYGQLGFPKLSCDRCGQAIRGASDTVVRATTEFARSGAGQATVGILDGIALAANVGADAALIGAPIAAAAGCVGGLAGAGVGCIAGAAGAWRTSLAVSSGLRITADAASAAAAGLTCLGDPLSVNCGYSAAAAYVGYRINHRVPFADSLLDYVTVLKDIAGMTDWSAGNAGPAKALPAASSNPGPRAFSFVGSGKE